MCEVCGGKRYLVATRMEGRRAIERCDECSWHGDDDPRTLWDEDAAFLAQADGIDCELDYPCYVLGHTPDCPSHTSRVWTADLAGEDPDKAWVCTECRGKIMAEEVG